MTMYTAGDRTPYVYTICFTHPTTGKKRWYIGSRYAVGCHPTDLLVTYPTSSVYFKKLYDEFEPSCFKPKVVKVLCCREEAVPYEGKLFDRAESFGLKRCRQLINRTRPGCAAVEFQSDEHKKKNSDFQKQMVRSKESNQKRSDKLKGRVISKEWANSISIALTGSKHDEQRRLKNSLSTKGIKKSESWKQKKRKTYSFYNPEGVVIVTENLQSLCDDNNLSRNNMYQVCAGKRNQHKGWRAA